MHMRQAFSLCLSSFFGELICDITRLTLCCTVYGIRGFPDVYTDDLAIAPTLKRETDAVHDLVHQYGNRWHFIYNARKSAVLACGEYKREGLSNSEQRVFKLGNERVKEKQNYDHLIQNL